MLRRPRRLAASALPVLLLSLSLAACGEESDSAGALESFEAVTISGDLGSEPEVEWKGEMSAGEPEAETIIEGDGPALAEGDEVLLDYWVGNGFTQEKTFSSYEEGSSSVTEITEDFSPVFAAALEGQTLGSRVAVTASAEEAFGEMGNPQLGIGNKDAVLLIVDVESRGEEMPAADWVPDFLEPEGDPTGFDFAGVPAPVGNVRKSVLIEGNGPEVEKGQTIQARYLGQVYDGKKPFDESYSAEQPASFVIGKDQVIKAWDAAIVGLPVGSRIVLEVPPKLGYGEKGKPDAGILPTDTLFFVIDVLGAASAA